MKYLKYFKESIFEGEDFLYKEINVREYRELELERDRIVPDEVYFSASEDGQWEIWVKNPKYK